MSGQLTPFPLHWRVLRNGRPDLHCCQAQAKFYDAHLMPFIGSSPDGSYARLRALSVSQPSTVECTTTVRPSDRERAREIATLRRIEELNQLALSLGYAICPIASIAQTIGKAIACRTRSREGVMVYQTASFSIPAISRQAALHLFAAELLQEETPNQATWLALTVKQVRELAGPVMEQSGYVCAGVTRALRTKSQRWSRVVAHIIPRMQVVHLARQNQLQIDFQYVLLDEMGEMHAPKDENRNEMQVSPVVASDARAQIRVDLLEMFEQQTVRLSPAFLRQLGMDQQAMTLEAQSSQLNLQQQIQGRESRSRTRVPRWEVSHIVEERGSRHKREYLVEWAGYHPSWEAWRGNGPGGVEGSPLQTWEPANALMGTEALINWLEREQA